nr:hypothetical protein [Nanoarchaeum sp.]
MDKPNLIKMDMRYKQFFSPNTDRARGTMNLDDAVADVLSFHDVLRQVNKLIPDKEKFQVGLGNCETHLYYSRGIICFDDLIGPKRVLDYFLERLAPEYRPFTISVTPFGRNSRVYMEELELHLNGLGKTFYPQKSYEDIEDVLQRLGSCDGIIRNLKRD